MKILAINAGSSTIKFTLFQSNDEKVITSGILKNYSEDKFTFEWKDGTENKLIDVSSETYKASAKFLSDWLIEKKYLVDMSELEFITHRVVHGGEEFTQATALSEENIKKIEEYSIYAPLHNPYSLEIIRQFKNISTNTKQYAVFDTSFHLTMTKENFLYGLPYGYYENLKVRRFGFHGTSHKYLSSKVDEIVKTSPPAPLLKKGEGGRGSGEVKLITCHLGSGSSVCAIKDGVAIDNSFGFSPDENLIMSTRSGEIDFDAVRFIKRKLGISDDEIEKLLNFESGLLGISGYTKDMKVLLKDYNTNDRAKLAVNMYVGRVVEYISRMFIILGGCDVLVFSAGVGCGSDVIRQMICDKLTVLGIKLFNTFNKGAVDVKEDLCLTHPDSKTAIWVIPTNEELQMMREVKKLKAKS